MPLKSVGLAVSSTVQSASVCTNDNSQIYSTIRVLAFRRRQDCVVAAPVGGFAQRPSTRPNPRIHHPTITPTSPNPQLQFTASFAPAATPCELHPTSAHPPHSTSHHRKCCPPVRLTVCIPERMVHA